MKKNKILIRSITAVFILSLFGCVGAIKENKENLAVGDGTLNQTPTFTFEGLTEAQAISDARINLTFKPAELIGGGEGNSNGGEGGVEVGFMYKVMRDGGNTPIASFVDTNLTLNPDGQYVVAVPTNGRGDCGTYNIIAAKADESESHSGATFFRVCSHNEFYPEFDGILAILPLSGCNLYNGAKITWRIANKSPELRSEIERFNTLKAENFTLYQDGRINFTTFNDNNATYDAAIDELNEYAPYSYSIYYATSQEALLEKLNDPTAVPATTVNNINASYFELTGLNSGVQYHFAVRSSTNVISSTARMNMETNVHIVTYTTPQINNINFGGITSVEIPKNTNGYNSAVVRYTACTGCDKYQYYAKSSALPLDIDSDVPRGTINLNEIPNNPESFTINGLQKHTNYYFYVVAINNCGVSGSPEVAGTANSIQKMTTPPISPFNGVTSIQTIGGALDRLKLNWSLPDTANGVYDEYVIYQTDNSGTIIRQLTNTNDVMSDDPYIDPVNDLTDPTLVSAAVRDVNAGVDVNNPNRFCFVVAPKEGDFNGPGGVGREMATADRRVVCKDFYYQAPNFVGPSAGNCANTSSSFNVSWLVPTEGTYSQFRLYYKIDENETEMDYAVAEAATSIVAQGKGEGSGFTRIEFDYDPLATPSLTPPLFAGAVSANPFTVNGLDPDTTYIFAMETYYDADGAGPGIPFFVRPSVLRRCRTSKPEVVHEGWEHIMALGPKTNGLDNGNKIKEKLSNVTRNSLTYLGSGAASDIDPLQGWYMEEDPSAPDTEGTVFLSWFDFKFSQLSGVYANSLIGSGSTAEYVVNRSLNADMSGATIIGTVPLIENVYLYNFLDENIPAHSRKYYYQVVLKVNGVDLVFASTDATENAINSSNAILSVIVPPPNMAFIHRYMFNKHQCRKIDRNIHHGKHAFPDAAFDRVINYDANSLTAYQVRGARGALFNTPTNKNYDIAKNYQCEYNGVGSTRDETTGNFVFDIGKSFLVDRFEVGAKIGLNACDIDGSDGGPYNCVAEYLSYRYEAYANTIFYELGHVNEYHATYYYDAYFDRADIWVNTSADGIASTAWTYLDNPAFSISQFTNISNQIFSNQAYLPPARIATYEKAKAYCNNRTININGNNYIGRLGSRQEYIVMGDWHEQAAPLDLIDITLRRNLTGSGKDKYGCNTADGDKGAQYNPVPYQDLAVSGGPTDITKNNYPTRNDPVNYAAHLLRTGSYSNNTEHSSHLCFSKFGLQDFVGNEVEMTDDWFINSGSGWMLDINKTPEEIKKYWQHTSKLSTEDGYLPTSTDFYGKHNLLADSFGFLAEQTSQFYNPLAGLKFACINAEWGVASGCYDYQAPPNNNNLNGYNNLPDWMNYMFAINSRDYSWNFQDTSRDGSPGVLVRVAEQDNYSPFNYHYLPDVFSAYTDGSTRQLTVGGSGYLRESSWQMGGDEGGVYNTRPKWSYTGNKVGIRCVFSVP